MDRRSVTWIFFRWRRSIRASTNEGELEVSASRHAAAKGFIREYHLGCLDRTQDQSDNTEHDGRAMRAIGPNMKRVDGKGKSRKKRRAAEGRREGIIGGNLKFLGIFNGEKVNLWAFKG